jgi:cytochrome b6-f complex iron-sulfur subunit
MAIDPFQTKAARLHELAEISRRQFFGILGILAATAATLFGSVQTLKFMFPNATGDPPLKFRVDVDPNAITVGNPLQITDKRVSIVRDDKGFYAVLLVCTHLGCTPNYTTSVTAGSGTSDAVAESHGFRTTAEQLPNGWACPCHGSRYFIDSTNFYGPAPRPMDWVDIQFSADGKFVVDRGKFVVQRSAGETTIPEWRLDLATGKDNGKTYGV